jgi:C-terminal processing protease CtpA/Prc
MTNDEHDLGQLIDRIIPLLRDRYVLEDDIPAILAGLGDVEIPAVDRTPARVAEVLTEHLQRGNHDRHLRVRHRPEGAASGFGGPEHEARYSAEARSNAGGVRQVRLLEDGIGYLDVAPYLSPVHLAEPYVAAAFTLLASAEALVIDLRDGLGGTPETVALVLGHLLGQEPVHLHDLEVRGQAPRQYWTTPSATRIAGPVRVLTSRRTFSACEELAYDLQTQSRARVVGETTGGGAHPVEAFRITETLELHVPVARCVNAVTGTNWEHLGVVPDLPCPPAAALEAALAELRGT